MEEDETKRAWKAGRNEGEMSWGWKLMASILYILPWVDITEKSIYFTERFPAFAWMEFFTGEGLNSPHGQWKVLLCPHIPDDL